MAQKKLIITLHANGPSKTTNPNLAYSPKEIADQAIECWRQGAAVVHYHICDPVTGAPSADVALFAETERLIKEQCDIITFPTLGALSAPSEGRVSHILELAKDPATKPDCIPLDVITTNLDAWNAETTTFNSLDRVYSNTTRTLMDIVDRVQAVGVKAVPMIWNVASVRVIEKFIEMGVLKEPLFCEVSVYGEPYLAFGHPATIQGLNSVLDFIPADADWRWTVSVIGANAFGCLANTIERGGDVAIGLHDHPYPELNFPTNAELIGRVADMARAMGREVATAAEAREILGFN
ncbi:MAG: 3-keto-5-aminohexanoate cleavage protein [Sphingobium sp.]